MMAPCHVKACYTGMEATDPDDLALITTSPLGAGQRAVSFCYSPSRFQTTASNPRFFSLNYSFFVLKISLLHPALIRKHLLCAKSIAQVFWS